MSTHQDTRNFIQLCISNALQDAREPESDRTNTLPMGDNTSEESDDCEQNSLLNYYLEKDDNLNRNSATENHQDISTLATPSLASDTDSDIDTINTRDDDTSLNLEEEDDQDNSVSKIQNGDSLPKTFLQLNGIVVGNFNMGCNFHISAALRIIIQYKIHILAIQEHTSWNRELTPHEITSIEKHCDKWGYFVKISKLQIIIIDKQLLACHRETISYKQGRIITLHFQILDKQCATFFATYGIPHSGNDRRHTRLEAIDENETLQEMRSIQENIKDIIENAKKGKSIIFIYGDLQDTPDNSKNFHYGKCRIPKHPLGITKMCEDMGLSCTIYQHMESLDKPIISRHGTKGGRFINGMYTCHQGLERIMGIAIVNDTGINSDHMLVVSNIDLGIQKFEVSTDREERIDFRRIMNIPMHIKRGETHPSLNTNVYKGADFRVHAQLYDAIQKACKDPNKNYMNKIIELQTRLQELELEVITKTKANVNEENQKNGKLIQRTIHDANIINNASSQFFSLINDICREVDLASKVPVVPSRSYIAKRNDVITEKIMPGITSIAITKQIDDTTKRARSILQRTNILLKSLIGARFRNSDRKTKN
jgi:hypothetical protein